MKQDLKFGEGKFLKLKEDPCTFLRKQDLKFGEGKFLKLKEIHVHTWGSKILSLGKESFSSSKRSMYILGKARS